MHWMSQTTVMDVLHSNVILCTWLTQPLLLFLSLTCDWPIVHAILQRVPYTIGQSQVHLESCQSQGPTP